MYTLNPTACHTVTPPKDVAIITSEVGHRGHEAGGWLRPLLGGRLQEGGGRGALVQGTEDRLDAVFEVITDLRMEGRSPCMHYVTCIPV